MPDHSPLPLLREHPQRWLVTGGAGFIGSHLVQALLVRDQQVVVADNFSTGYRANLEDVTASLPPEQAGRLELMEGDLRDPDLCSRAVNGIDRILHQAALGSVPGSIAEPADTHAHNVGVTVQLMDAARRSRVRRFVYASSSAVYGDDPRLPKIEDDTGRSLSPYAAHKTACELNASVFAHCYGLETVGLRYFNVVGARQDPRGAYAAVIPLWISAMLRGEPVFINGDGQTSRDFISVRDVVAANLLAATQDLPSLSNVCNVATGKATSLNALFEEIRAAVLRHRPDLEIPPPIHRAFREGDIRHSHGDTTRARELLDFSARVGLNNALDEVVSWFLEQESGQKPPE